MNANELKLFDKLSHRYHEPEWVLVSQVATASGWIDAVAVNFYPSHGFAVHGFELKSSRSDWLRELKSPRKAEIAVMSCDYFWIVVSDKDIVQPGELPHGWGLLTPSGGGLRVSTAAHRNDDHAMTPALMVAIIRRAGVELPGPKALAEAHDEGFAAGKIQGKQWDKVALKRLRSALSTSDEKLDVLIKAGDDALGHWMNVESIREVGEQIGAAMRASASKAKADKAMTETANRLRVAAKQIDELREKGIE